MKNVAKKNGLTALDLVELAVIVKDGDIRFELYNGMWRWSIVDADERLIVRSEHCFIEVAFLKLVRLFEAWRLENRRELSKKSASA